MPQTAGLSVGHFPINPIVADLPGNRNIEVSWRFPLSFEKILTFVREVIATMVEIVLPQFLQRCAKNLHQTGCMVQAFLQSRTTYSPKKVEHRFSRKLVCSRNLVEKQSSTYSKE